MPPVTKGHLLVTPLTIKTSASLAEIAAAADARRINGESIEPGWGSVQDPVDVVGKNGMVTLHAGGPQVIAATDRAPEHFRGRLYWREVDRRGLRYGGEEASISLMELNAADVFISASGEGGEHLGLVSLRNESQINNYAVPALQSLLQLVDHHSSLLTSTSALDLGGEDFFRWLLYRAHNDPDLTTTLTIETLRSISGQDASFRPTALSRGVDIDRPELLALIMASNTQFGPAKLVVTETDLDLEADFELRLDGGFSAHLGRSFYEEDLSRADKGLRILADLAWRIIPEMFSAYNSDQEWRDTHRQESIDDARRALRAALDRLDRL